MSGFRASKGHQVQYVQFAGKYCKLTWPVLECGSDFDTMYGTHNPPPGPVLLSAFVWISTGMMPKNGVIKIMKNAIWENYTGYQLPGGIEIGTGIGCVGTFPGSFVMSIPGVFDIASAGDKYSIGLYADSGNVCVDGHPAHTWFSGLSFPNQ